MIQKIKTVKLTEKELTNLISESVKKIISEQNFYTDDLIEYARLVPEQTGLNVVIYVDDGGAYKRNGHPLWLFMQNNYNNDNDVVPVVISKKPYIIGNENTLNISQRDLTDVLMFAKINSKLLNDFANDKIGHLEFYQQCRKGIKLPSYVTEMATLKPKDSNLPTTIWIDEGTSPQHGPRVKFQVSNEQHTTREFASMTISKEPIVFNLPKKM